MITLKDGTQWPDEDYHAQRAKELECTRAQAKWWLLIQNYGQGNQKLKDMGK